MRHAQERISNFRCSIDNADGFAAALCGGSVDVDPMRPVVAERDFVEHEVAFEVSSETRAWIPRRESVCGTELRAAGGKHAAAQVASRCDP